MRRFIRSALVKAIEKADMEFRNTPDRTRFYHVTQTRIRTIITIFGETTFTRTGYVNLSTGESYIYIDRKLALLPRQTIYNFLHMTGKITRTPVPADKTPDVLYVMADEKYNHLQGEHRGNESAEEKKKRIKEMVKLGVCFESREAVKDKNGDDTGFR